MIIMKYAKYIACLTVALLLTVELFAQTAVSGRITDKNGESVIGATILVKGTTYGKRYCCREKRRGCCRTTGNGSKE